MYKVCVFDLDGTLVNTIADIAYGANRALQQMGYPTHEEEAFRWMVGNGMQMLCKRALPKEVQDNNAILAELVERYNSYYCEHCCDISRPYPGIPEMIEKLKQAGVLCAVISNKPHPQTQIVMRTLFQNDDFFYIEGQSERFARKPDPEALLDCISHSKASKSDVVYVGDSDVDAVFAHNAGIDCIGVAWGFRGKEELEHAGVKYLAETAEDIVDIVTG
ncbi:MAG: HAD family hydrolase [Eubacterium sp.]|nr:HAD family hydrolase [Eubacterium sp.]